MISPYNRGVDDLGAALIRVRYRGVCFMIIYSAQPSHTKLPATCFCNSLLNELYCVFVARRLRHAIESRYDIIGLAFIVTNREDFGVLRRYVVWPLQSWRACTTEALRSFRSSMLSWGAGLAGAGSSRYAPSALPVSIEEYSSDEAIIEAQGALLAGSVARTRRRHAVKIKRKSKVAIRALRYWIINFHKIYFQ